jgi:hypothetical protein
MKSGLVQCRISVRPPSVVGHSRQIDPLPTLSAFRSDHVRTFAPQRFDVVCHEPTLAAVANPAQYLFDQARLRLFRYARSAMSLQSMIEARNC